MSVEAPTHELVQNNGRFGYQSRMMMGTPTRGTVRIEWHHALAGQILPANWCTGTMIVPMSTLIPIRFQVADAQNVIVQSAVAGGYEWLLLLEDDVLPPRNLFVRLTEYMKRAEAPVISGLYYQKSEPSEPLIYRGRGNGAFDDFQPGDLVWADGVPTGCLLISGDLLRVMYNESEEYEVGGQRVRRVFEDKSGGWILEDGTISVSSGTSDLHWCRRVIEGDFFAKSGWTEFQEREWPFLVDTRIACGHITPDGQVFPSGWTTEV